MNDEIKTGHVGWSPDWKAATYPKSMNVFQKANTGTTLTLAISQVTEWIQRHDWRGSFEAARAAMEDARTL